MGQPTCQQPPPQRTQASTRVLCQAWDGKFAIPVYGTAHRDTTDMLSVYGLPVKPVVAFRKPCRLDRRVALPRRQLPTAAAERPDRKAEDARRARSRKGKSVENKKRRRGRPAWTRSPDDTPLRDGNRDRLIGLLTQRAAATLCYYLMETNLNVHHWLMVYMHKNPIPHQGAWDDISGETFLRQLLAMPLDHAKWTTGRDVLYDNIPGCGVDPRSLAQRIMAIRSQIANEMIEDLKQVSEENSLLMRESLFTSLSMSLDDLPVADKSSTVTNTVSPPVLDKSSTGSKTVSPPVVDKSNTASNTGTPPAVNTSSIPSDKANDFTVGKATPSLTEADSSPLPVAGKSSSVTDSGSTPVLDRSSSPDEKGSAPVVSQPTSPVTDQGNKPLRAADKSSTVTGSSSTPVTSKTNVAANKGKTPAIDQATPVTDPGSSPSPVAANSSTLEDSSSTPAVSTSSTVSNSTSPPAVSNSSTVSNSTSPPAASQSIAGGDSSSKSRIVHETSSAPVGKSSAGDNQGKSPVANDGSMPVPDLTSSASHAAEKSNTVNETDSTPVLEKSSSALDNGITPAVDKDKDNIPLPVAEESNPATNKANSSVTDKGNAPVTDKDSSLLP